MHLRRPWLLLRLAELGDQRLQLRVGLAVRDRRDVFVFGPDLVAELQRSENDALVARHQDAGPLTVPQAHPRDADFAAR